MDSIRKQQEAALFAAVKGEAGDRAAATVVYGEAGEVGEAGDAAWVEGAMCRLRRSFDGETVKRIRMDCQCGYGMAERLALLEELKQGASSLAELAASDKAQAAGLSWRDGALYLQFPFCPCPMLAQVARLRDMSWCQCSAGYSKVLFEQALGCPVEVTMLQSVKCGDPICLMRIQPQGGAWA